MKRRTMLKRLGMTGLVLAGAGTGTTMAQSSDDLGADSLPVQCYGGCCSEGHCEEILQHPDCDACWCDDC